MLLDDKVLLRGELGSLSLSSPSTSVASYFHSTSIAADAGYSLMPFLSARRTPFVVDELVVEPVRTAGVNAIADVVPLEPAS